MARWGLPYQGSKNGIAEWVVDNLPSSNCLVDLFAGGCAITHCAMVKGKWGRIIANDRQGDILQLFKNAVDGKYRNEKRWISREDFERLKDYDPYVKYCWSFGNKGINYLYGEQIYNYKKAMWEAIVDRDYSAICNYSERIPELIDAPTQRQRRINYRHDPGILYQIIDGATLLRDLPFKYTEKCKPKNTVGPSVEVEKFLNGDYRKRKDKKELKDVKGWQSLVVLQHLEACERLERLQSLESLESLNNNDYLTITNLDYKAVELPQDATIYCDPPYRGTTQYHGVTFDFNVFDAWLNDINRLVIVSEYTAPKNFVCVAHREKTALMSGSRGGADTVTECLFVHEKFVDEYKQKVQIGKTAKMF